MRGGISDDMDDRKTLGVGASDTVDGGELTNAIGCYHLLLDTLCRGCTDSRLALHTGVSVGGVSAVQFIGVANYVVRVIDTRQTPSDLWHLLNIIQKLQIHVPRDSYAKSTSFSQEARIIP